MQNKPSQKIVFLLTTVCFPAFFIFGITDNLKGPTFPALLFELKINYGVGGNIFFGEYFGFLISTLLTGILADRFGLKMVMLLAGTCLALGVGGYSVFQTATMLAASLFVIGLGLGGFELGSNAIIVNLHNERKGLFLNLMAVLHGLGSMIAPLFAAWLFGMATSWRVIYRWDLFLICFFLLLAFTLRFPRVEEESQLDFRKISEIAFKGQICRGFMELLHYMSPQRSERHPGL